MMPAPRLQQRPIVTYLDDLCRSRNTNRYQLSHKTGIGYSTMNNWGRTNPKTGKPTSPDIATLAKIERALDLPQDEADELRRLASHGVSRRGVGAYPSVIPQSGERSVDTRERMSVLVNSALRPARGHRAEDAVAVMDALEPVAANLDALGDADAAAAMWLDAAAAVRKLGWEITAASLALMVPSVVGLKITDAQKLQIAIERVQTEPESRTDKKTPKR